MKKKLLSLFLALTLVCSLAAPALAAGDKYAGIEPGAWYETAAKAAVDGGMMTGTDQGFAPNGKVTRSQIYQIIYNLEGKPTPGATAGFTDVADAWYADAANWAVGAGVLAVGEGKTFDGDAPVSRAEVAQVIMNYAQLKGITAAETGTPIAEAPDYASIPAQYLPGVSFCYYAGVMVGDSEGKLTPDASVTRAQLAQVMANFATLKPAYSEEAVSIAVPEQGGIPAHDVPAIVTLPLGAAGKVPGVVMLHGTGSDKNEAGGGYALAAPQLALNGIASIRIDFMGSGASKADYANYNYTSAKLDAKAAADYLGKVAGVDAAKLGVMGWSQGGTNALLAAAAYPETFQAVVTWSGALTLSTMFQDFKAAQAEAEKNGFFEMTFDWREPLHFGAQWFQEVAATDMTKIVAEIKAPILAINGDKDDVVPMDNAVAIQKAAKDGETWIVDGADHTYNIFSGDNTAIDNAILNTAVFFQRKLTGGITGAAGSISKYGNVNTNVPKAVFDAAGFQPGDILTVTVGGKTVDAPYGDAYSNVDTGKAVVVPDKSGVMAVAVNMGNFAEIYKVAVGTPLAFAMKEKGGYLAEYEIRNIDAKRTNERTDYASDEVFANFRPVVMGNIPAGVLYRASSPINPELGRNVTADALAEKAGIATVLNLADSKDSMLAYEGFDESYYSTLNIIPLNMSVDFNAEDFNAKLKTGLVALADPMSKGPYLIHCNEGKDRAGFVAALLEALMGGDVDEIAADYMVSFVNYYHVEQGSEQYNKIMESNILANLRMIAGLEAGADLSKMEIDLEQAAENYLIKTVGLTAGEVGALKTVLSTPTAAEKAA